MVVGIHEGTFTFKYTVQIPFLEDHFESVARAAAFGKGATTGEIPNKVVGSGKCNAYLKLFISDTCISMERTEQNAFSQILWSENHLLKLSVSSNM